MKDNYTIVEGKKYKLVPVKEEIKKVNSGFVNTQIVENCNTAAIVFVDKFTILDSYHLSWQNIARLCAPLDAVKGVLEVRKKEYYISFRTKHDFICFDFASECIYIPYRGTVDLEEPTEIDIEWIMKDE